MIDALEKKGIVDKNVTVICNGFKKDQYKQYIVDMIHDGFKNIIPVLDNKEEFVLILRKKYFDELNLPQNWKKVLADFRHYSSAEQINIPQLIENEKPDLVHFPHINVPVLYNKPFIVTIHDMTMHHQGVGASTLPLYKYLLKRIPYKVAFRHAVNKSKKIITPSETVKDEIVNYFQINPGKVEVIYEGIDVDFEKKNSTIMNFLSIAANFHEVN